MSFKDCNNGSKPNVAMLPARLPSRASAASLPPKPWPKCFNKSSWRQNARTYGMTSWNKMKFAIFECFGVVFDISKRFFSKDLWRFGWWSSFSMDCFWFHDAFWGVLFQYTLSLVGIRELQLLTSPHTWCQGQKTISDVPTVVLPLIS